MLKQKTLELLIKKEAEAKSNIIFPSPPKNEPKVSEEVKVKKRILKI
jgi:hypothetical protein